MNGVKRFSLTLLILLVASPAWSDEANRSAGKSQRGQETSFGAEQSFARPVAVPNGVLRILRRDERVRMCLSRHNIAPAELPPLWFMASAINLNNDQRPDLIVRADNACMFGANIVPFWIFRNTARGYELVLQIHTLGVTLLPASTNGHRNIRTDAASAVRIFTNIYRFNGRTYRAAGVRRS